MQDPAKRVFSDALRLPIPERAELAAELLASLDGEADPDVEAAWADEIQRRIARIESGSAFARPWPAVREELDRTER
ncbi:MAG: addiction module protein [Candidatus Eisenbacteria bacterium]|nr:addiction module protein [Candidatus Eisenbacteria bacterium]MCC7141418.1 addiction module protein [Candidatus Eisenbacteria bacterium]